MNILDDFTLSSPSAQTGVPHYDFHPEIIKGALLLPGGMVFDDSDLASVANFNTKIQAGLLAVGRDRIYPIWSFENGVNNTAKPVDNTFGYGGIVHIRDSNPDMTFEMWHGGHLLFQQLRKLNNDTSRTVILIDQVGNYILTSGDLLTAQGFAFNTMSFEGYKFKDGSKPDSWDVHMVLSSPQEFYDNLHVIPSGMNLQYLLKGLIQVRLSIEAASVVASLKVIARTADGSTYMMDVYESELEDETLWLLTKDSDGSDVALTSVTHDDAIHGFTVVPTAPLTLDANYTLTWVGPAALAVAGIGGPPENGYEALPVTVMIPT